MKIDKYFKSALRYEISIYKKSIKIIKLFGSFTLETFSKIDVDIIAEFNDKHYKLFVLDLKEAKFLTSFAVSKIIYFYKVVKCNDNLFVIQNASPNVISLFKLANIESLFNIFNNFEQVISFYEQSFGKIPNAVYR